MIPRDCRQFFGCGLLRPARISQSAIRDMPLSINKLGSGSFFSNGKITVTHSSRRGSGHSVYSFEPPYLLSHCPLGPIQSSSS